MYGILIYDGVEPIDIGATVGVLSMARRVAPDLNYVTLGKSAGEVTCANGLKVLADHGFKDAPPVTDLIVTGGPGWTEAAADPEILAFLRNTPARLTSICTGAMILAAAGRLDGKTVTTKHEVFDGETAPADLLRAQADPAGGAVIQAALVDHNGTVTGGGVTLGLDTMFYCLARSHGADVAAETARVMEYSRALSANRLELGYKITAGHENAA